MPAPEMLKYLCDQGNKCNNFARMNSLVDSATETHLDTENWLPIVTQLTKHTRRENRRKSLFRHYSGWLYRQITLSFSLSNEAGAFSIAPVLEVQIYRDEGS